MTIKKEASSLYSNILTAKNLWRLEGVRFFTTLIVKVLLNNVGLGMVKIVISTKVDIMYFNIIFHFQFNLL